MAANKVSTVSPQEINDLIEKASKEPGINDVLALLRLSQEIGAIQQIASVSTEEPLISQVSGTAGWVR